MGLTNNNNQESKPLKGYEASIYISPLQPQPAISLTPGYQQISIEPISEESFFKSFEGFKTQIPHPLNGVMTEQEFRESIELISASFFAYRGKLKTIKILLIVFLVLFFFPGFIFLTIYLAVIGSKIGGQVRKAINDLNARFASRGITFTLVTRRHQYVIQNVNGVQKRTKVPTNSLYIQYPALVTPVTMVNPVQYQSQQPYQQPYQQPSQQPQPSQQQSYQSQYPTQPYQPQQYSTQPYQPQQYSTQPQSILDNQPNLNYSIDRNDS